MDAICSSSLVSACWVLMYSIKRARPIRKWMLYLISDRKVKRKLFVSVIPIYPLPHEPPTTVVDSTQLYMKCSKFSVIISHCLFRSALRN